MNELEWNYDRTTEYWAKKLPLPLSSSHPVPQYDGLDYRLWEDTWKKHILRERFPEYCRYPNTQESLLCSPSNIIRCFQDHKVLEALVLTVAWGRMSRSKGNIYQKSNQEIEKTLLACLTLTDEKNSVEESWNLLVKRLNWGSVITSKCLHFLARSLGYETNPPVPIDNKVLLEEVWPTFKKAINDDFRLGVDTMPQKWGDKSSSWEAYNRYMTTINCWAQMRGWTTTQLENTIFEEYYPRR
jgi:hypothetical protein